MTLTRQTCRVSRWGWSAGGGRSFALYVAARFYDHPDPEALASAGEAFEARSSGRP